MGNVSYWRGVVDDDLVREHSVSIQKLLNGELGGLEKLRGYDNIYSLRTSDEGRLIFTTLIIKGEHYIHLLEFLPHHDYQKSRFLRAGVLRDYLSLNSSSLAEHVLHFDVLETIPDELKKTQKGENPRGNHPVGLDYFRREFIELDSVQLKAIDGELSEPSEMAVAAAQSIRIDFPALIFGPPGSGKTFIGDLLLKKYIQGKLNNGDIEPVHIAYVTSSRDLVSMMADSWAAHPFSVDLSPHLNVNFLTYDEMFGVDSQHTNHPDVSMTAFKSWLKSYTMRHRIKKSIDIPSVDVLYHEFRICSGYETFKDYCDVKSLDRVKKKWIFDAYQDYRTSPFCAASLFKVIEPGPRYQLLVVDEAHDFTTQQLKNLYFLSQDFNIVFCLDNNQSLYDQVSKEPFLNQLIFKTTGRKYREVILPHTYRCAPLVARLGTTILEAKRELVKGLQHKLDAIEIVSAKKDDEDDGEVNFVELSKLQEEPWLKSPKGPDFAVVTLPQLCQEATELFGTDLVFTPAQIKGLQFRWVVTYQLFAKDTFIESYRHLSYASAADLVQNRAKSRDEDTSVAPSFNEFYTTLTRTMHRLTFVEKSTYQNEILFQRLKDNASYENSTSSDAPSKTPNVDWLQTLIYLNQSSKNTSEQQAAIYQNQLTPDQRRQYDLWKTAHEKKTVIFPLADKASLSSESDIKPGVIAIKGNVSEVKPIVKVKKQLDQQEKIPGSSNSHLLKNIYTNLCVNFTEENLQAYLSLVPESTFVKKGVPISIPKGVLYEVIIRKKANTALVVRFIKERKYKELMYKLSHLIFYPDVIYVPDILIAVDLIEIVKAFIIVYPEVILNNASCLSFLLAVCCSHERENKSEMQLAPLLLHTLTGHEHGVLILTKLMSYIDFQDRILSSPAWFDANAHAPNQTPIYKLCASSYGQEFLALYIPKLHTFCKRIPAPFFGVALPKEAGSDEKMTPLYRLASSKLGRSIILLFLERYSNFLEDTNWAWGLTLTSNAGIYENTSVFYLLSKHDLNLLTRLFIKNARLFSIIFSEVCCAIRPDQSSVFSNLVLSQEGRAIYAGFMTNTTSFSERPPIKLWGIFLGATVNLEILFWLVAQSWGLEVLSQILREYPQWIADIPKEIWHRIYPMFAEESLIEILTRGSGSQFLIELLDNLPDIILSIPPETWVETQCGLKIMPIRSLIFHDRGLKFLSLFAERYPAVFCTISRDHWFAEDVLDQCSLVNFLLSLHEHEATSDAECAAKILRCLDVEVKETSVFIDLDAVPEVWQEPAELSDDRYRMFSRAVSPNPVAVAVAVIADNPNDPEGRDRYFEC